MGLLAYFLVEPAGSIASWSILALYHAPVAMPVAAIKAVFVILRSSRKFTGVPKCVCITRSEITKIN